MNGVSPGPLDERARQLVEAKQRLRESRRELDRGLARIGAADRVGPEPAGPRLPGDILDAGLGLMLDVLPVHDGACFAVARGPADDGEAWLERLAFRTAGAAVPRAAVPRPVVPEAWTRLRGGPLLLRGGEADGVRANLLEAMALDLPAVVPGAGPAVVILPIPQVQDPRAHVALLRGAVSGPGAAGLTERDLPLLGVIAAHLAAALDDAALRRELSELAEDR